MSSRFLSASDFRNRLKELTPDFSEIFLNVLSLIEKAASEGKFQLLVNVKEISLSPNVEGIQEDLSKELFSMGYSCVQWEDQNISVSWSNASIEKNQNPDPNLNRYGASESYWKAYNQSLQSHELIDSSLSEFLQDFYDNLTLSTESKTFSRDRIVDLSVQSGMSPETTESLLKSKLSSVGFSTRAEDLGLVVSF